jgi:hypothetical protein
MTLVWKSGLNLQSPASNDPLLDLNTQPSLDLQFATGKTLDDRVSGNNLVTFSRASSGTYVGSDGLIKTSPVNLFPNSEQFNQSTWTKANGAQVTPNAAEDPAGGNTADLINFTGGSQQVYFGFAPPAGTYTMSVYLRVASGSKNLRMQSYSPTDGVQNKAITVTDTWQRFSHTVVVSNVQTTFLPCSPVDLGEVYFWGAQLEEGSTATTYIPTTSTISGAPRFDHDPVTGKSLGLLIEEARTNYVDNSNDLSQWNRVINSATTESNTADTLSPDGTNNSTKITGGSSSGMARDNVLSASASTTYVSSIFAKKGSTDSFLIEFGSGGNYVKTTFNLTNKTFSNASAGGWFASVSTSYVDYPNGWVRVILSGTTSGSASGDLSFAVYGINSGYAYLWGAQVEVGSFPTSCLPTSGSTVTRAADVASIEGTNFSSWYNQSEGTVFVEAESSDGVNGVLGVGSTTEPVGGLNYDFSGFNVQWQGGVMNGTFNPVDGSFHKFAFTTTTTSNILFADGTQQSTAVATGSRVATDLIVGNRTKYGGGVGTSHHLNGHIARLTYYPYRLADATLQEITS